MGLVRSFQISAMFPHLTVLDNVRVALQRPQRPARPVLALARRRSTALTPRAEELLQAVGLDDARDQLAADLSYGRKRVLEIATTLALDPKVLLLDEPMAGMGHEDVGTVSEIIRAIAKDRAVLMVEHNLSVVADLCRPDHRAAARRDPGRRATTRRSARTSACAPPIWGPSMTEARRCSRSATSRLVWRKPRAARRRPRRASRARP